MADLQAPSSLRIPPQYLPGMEKVIALDRESFSAIVTALEGASPSVYVKNLSTEVASRVESIPPKDISDIIKTVVSLNTVRNYYKATVTDWVSAITEFVNNSEKFLNFSNEQKISLKERLTVLLSLDGAITIVSKAKALVLEHECVYANSHIITDIRPVFASEVDKGIAGALIVHSLKLEYREGESKKEFFVALDTNDIKELREQLDRADKKAEAIELMLKKAEVHYLNV